MLSFDLLAQLVLFVQRSVFVFDDIHLEHGARGVFLCLDDLDLSTMVLDLGDDVYEDLFQALQLASKSHLLLALQTKHSL